MGFVVDLPDARKVSLSQLYDYISTNNPNPNVGELISKGYLELIKAGIITDAQGYLLWGTDALGQKLTVEANSANVKSNTSWADFTLRNNPYSARLIQLGVTARATEFDLVKGPTATLTVAGGAGAAAQQVLVDSSGIAGIADGDKVYLEKLHISCLCATSTDNMILTLSSSDATPTELMRLAINGMTSQMVDVMLDLGDAYLTTDPTYGDIVAQGLAGLNAMTDNDLIYLTPYYRVI